MLKIGFDAKRLFNNFTGLGNYSRTLLDNLNHYFPGNEYHLYTPKIKLNRRTQPYLNQSNVKVHQPNLSILKHLWRTSGMISQWKNDGIQLYHGLSHELPVGVQKAAPKSIVTIHDLVLKHYPDFFPWIDRQIYDWKFKYACDHADMIIAISESTKKDIVRFYNIEESKIKVIYQTCHAIFRKEAENFADQESREKDHKIEDKFQLPQDYLLYVGSIIPRKNLMGCIKALENLPASLKLPLLIVGNGKKYKKKIQQYVSQKGLEKEVVFCPSLNLKELRTVYQKAKILLYPSFYEGFGLPIIEALYSETPVITSEVSSLPEAGGEGAYYVNPNNFEEIGIGIEQLLTDDDFYNEKRRKGIEHVKKFHPQKVTKELMSTYQQLL